MLTVDSEFTVSKAMSVMQGVIVFDNARHRVVWSMEYASWTQMFVIRDTIAAIEKFCGSRISDHVFIVPSAWWRVWLRGILYSCGVERPIAIVLSGSPENHPEGTYAMV